MSRVIYTEDHKVICVKDVAVYCLRPHKDGKCVFIEFAAKTYGMSIFFGSESQCKHLLSQITNFITNRSPKARDVFMVADYAATYRRGAGEDPDADGQTC